MVEGLRKIKQVSEIVVITNGTLLTKDKIDNLEKAGLTRINLSLHSMNKEKSRKLFGMPNYDVDKVLDMINYITKSKIKLLLTPVWLPGVNDEDIEEIIELSKNIDCGIGLQKYEVYPHSRKMSGAKKVNYWKFYNKVKKLEEEYKIKLKVTMDDFKVERRNRIPEVFEIGEMLNAEILCDGWFPGQKIGKAGGRCISINDCDKEEGEMVRVKILQNKNSLYLAECA